MEAKKDTTVITLRMERQLIERIDVDAKDQNRSRTGQIVHMISQYYKTKDQYLQ